MVTLKRYKVILKAIKNDSKLKMKRIKGRRWENAKLKFKRYRIYNKNNNKIYNKDKQNFKKTKPNFEERTYEGFDFNTLAKFVI